MTDLAARNAAVARLQADPTLVNRLAGEVRRITKEIAHRHPAGAQAVGNIMHPGLNAASRCEHNSAEQILTIEALHREMLKLEAEAVAEDARRAKEDMAFSLAQRAAMAAGGCVGVPSRDPGIIDAARPLGHRLQHLSAELDSRLPEAGFLDALDVLDRDVRTFLALIGASRRAVRLRISAEAARQAVAELKAA